MALDATTIGGVFSGVALVVSAISSVQLNRRKRDQERLALLEKNASRDATALAEQEEWQYQARRYFAALFNYLAAMSPPQSPPPPPAELGLTMLGSQAHPGRPPSKPARTTKSRHRRPATATPTTDDPEAP